MPLKATLRSAAEAWRYVRKHGVWKATHAKDAPWMIQFAKYGFCGVVALVVHNTIAIALAHGDWLPALEERVADQELRAKNQFLGNLVAFPFGLVAAYATNAIWVFTGGRHSRVKEFALFTVIGLISFLAGLAFGPLLVKLFGVPFEVAQISFIVSSALVNFVCRKFLVFKH